MGKVIQSFLKGFYTFLNSKRIWIFQYAMNILFAILLAYPLKSLLEKAAGYSLGLDTAFKNFDYTLVNDFLQNYGFGISTIRTQTLIAFPFYFCLLIFCNAGIIHVVQRYPGAYKFRDFLAGGAEYFWRFLRLSLYFLVVYVALAFIGFKIATIDGLSPFALENELGLISKSKIVLVCLGILFFLLGIIQDVIKVLITRSRENYITRSIVQGIGFVRKHFAQFLVLAILQLLLLIALLLCYYLFRNYTNGSTRLFLFLFVVGQAFILMRIGLRIWRLSSVYQLILRA